MQVKGSPGSEWAASFLSEQTVPVRLATTTPAGGLWMLSLWYEYDDDALHLATSASARVVDYLEHDDRVAFEVSTNEIPYRGVRGQGRASMAIDDEKTLLRRLVDRYLGGADNDLAAWLLRDEREEVHVTVDVANAYAWDYSDRMTGVRRD